jgi:hypothetical protein
MLSACVVSVAGVDWKPAGKSDPTNEPARAIDESADCDAAPAPVVTSSPNPIVIAQAAASARVERRIPEPTDAMYGLD